MDRLRNTDAGTVDAIMNCIVMRSLHCENQRKVGSQSHSYPTLFSLADGKKAVLRSRSLSRNIWSEPEP
jgi:hypothetical protein